MGRPHLRRLWVPGPRGVACVVCIGSVGFAFGFAVSLLTFYLFPLLSSPKLIILTIVIIYVSLYVAMYRLQ